MIKPPVVKLYTEADLLAVEAFSEKSREIVALYARGSTVTLMREEDGIPLEGIVFGEQCLKVFREWLENPMPAGLKREAMMRWDFRR